MTIELEKPIPMNLDAERVTLGSILLDRDAILAVAPWLKAEHIFNRQHAKIYGAMLACYERRVPPDMINVSDELRRRGQLDAVGGLSYLSELSRSVPTASHIVYYARIVKRTATARRLIVAGSAIAALGYDEGDDPDKAMSKAQRLLLDVEDTAGPKVGAGEEVLDTTVSMVLGSKHEKIPSPSTGFVGLDDFLSFRPGKLFLLAGRPGAGKSTIIGPISESFLDQGYQVLLYSGEMKRDEIMMRWICRKTGISMKRLTDDELSPDEQTQVIDAAGEIQALVTYADEDGERHSRWHVMDDTATIHEIERTAIRLRHQNPQPLLIIIDHIGLVDTYPGVKQNDLYTSTTLNSKYAKQIAMNTNSQVLCLVQMNREIERRGAAAEPHLSDLRESGGLEQDADIICFLARSQSFIEDMELATTSAERSQLEGIVHLYLKKNRNGSTGLVNLMTCFGKFEMRG